jgi:signal transduction histidine kinase
MNSGEHPKEFFAGMYAVITQGNVWHGEIRNRTKGGSFFWVEMTVVPFRGGDGEISSYVAISTDVTARRELAASLAVARDQALTASRLKSEFLATMSHEIRTPMNGVIGMAALLMESTLAEEQRDMARVILGSAENLLGIINDILDFSKIEAGKLRIEPEAFELRPLVEETLALLATHAHEKRIELVCDFDGTLTGGVRGDAGRIRQVLTNLVGNAVKFTETGEVVVRVRRRRERTGWMAFRVEVQDTGIGILPEVQSRLFEAFTQADGTTTRRFGGTGLGLAISRQLIELMMGSIGFESEPGRGSTFWFELELPRCAASAAGMPGLPATARLLVVDDNPTNRRILAEQLAGLGLHADAVADGPEALRRLGAAAARRGGEGAYALRRRADRLADAGNGRPRAGGGDPVGPGFGGVAAGDVVVGRTAGRSRSGDGGGLCGVSHQAGANGPAGALPVAGVDGAAGGTAGGSVGDAETGARTEAVVGGGQSGQPVGGADAVEPAGPHGGGRG